MLGAIISEEGLQKGCRSIRVEEKADLFNLISLLTVSLQLIS